MLELFIAYSARWQLKGSVIPGAFLGKTFGMKVGITSPRLLTAMDQGGELMVRC